MSHVHVTSRVWLRISNLRWIGGVVEGVDDKQLIIRTEDGNRVAVPRGSDSVSQRTPHNLEAVDNLTSLPDLDEPNMLHSLNVRYLDNKIYTRTGPILVCMNPWQDLKLYEQAILKMYRRQKLDNVPPHVFAIAEAAFANLQSERKDQTILVSGDSGSGKTESTKFMMQYLAAVAHHTAITANTEQQVLQCNPVLEAFGNAKTLRNDNSSRFGKYIDIHFDETFALCGAKIDTYLLEKSRVVDQEKGERNFHIFYQLCTQNNSVLRLLPAEQFRYVEKGVNVSVGYKPANSFQNTVQALEGIGILQEEREEIFKVLAAVLHLGNLEIGLDKEHNAVLSHSDPSATLISELLGCNTTGMVNALCIRNIQAGTIASGDSYTVQQSRQQAVDSRDALSRALYGNMFDVLVARINKSLGQQKRGRTRNISILDIFGFEHFKSNHFEQFCINYANEKLQGHFNEFNFSLEIQEYQRENIQWSYDDFYFQTNTKCIELIEGKRNGMLALLDEQCIMPNGNDETFCTKLKQDIPDHPHLYTAKMKGHKFTLKHYAAEVVYDAEGFCFKNKDPVQPAIVELLHNSKSTYVQSLFDSHWQKLEDANSKSKGPRGQSSLIFESVTAQFKRQLADLMLRINAAQPHFVRCINPNSHKMPHKLEPEMILDQLRCSGLMEAVRVSRAGFPVRVSHSDFVNRFSILIPVPPAANVAAQAASMCQGLRIPQEHYRMGKTKVFMRREINDKLEEERSKLLVKQALTIQRVLRGHIARNYVRYIRVMRHKAASQMQRMVRRLLVRRWYLDMLDKRRKLLEQQAAAASKGQIVPGKPSPAPGSALLNVPEMIRPSGTLAGPLVAPPNFSSANVPNSNLSIPGISTTDPHLAPRVVSGINPRVVDELELNLNYVRQLYYNERSSQIALSKLVKEIHALQDPDEILKRIKSLEDKIASQRKEDGSHHSGNKFEDQALGHRTDSLTACMALLEEKMHLILQSQRVPSRSDFARMRAEVEREYQAEVSSKLRVASEAQMQLEAARAEIRRKDDEIAVLNNRLLQMQVPAYGQVDMESLESLKIQMMNDRAMLEDIIRNERKQREEEFNDMDANVRTRDERIRELDRQNKELQMEMARRVALKDQELQNKDRQIQELGMMLHQHRPNGSPAGGSSGGDAGLQRAYAEQIASLQREKNSLEQKLTQVSRMQGGIQSSDIADAERMEAVGRQLATISQAKDVGTIGASATNVLLKHIQECTEQQRQLAGSGDHSKLQALSAQRRMLEACKNTIARLSGAPVTDMRGVEYASQPTMMPNNTGNVAPITQIGSNYQRSYSGKGEDMVLM